MSFLHLKRNRLSVIGVEFGACSVRAVQLRKAASGWQIHHWVNIETEPESPEQPEPDYAQAIQLSFGPGTFSGQRVSLALSPPDLEYHLLEVPPAVLKRPAPELRTALAYELDRQMPWPSAESEVAAWPVSSAGGSGTMVVAARTASICRLLDILDRQQLECLRADIVPNAMVRVCQGRISDFQSSADSGRNVAGESGIDSRKSEIHALHRTARGGLLWGALDVGFRSCRLYLIHDGRLVYARVLRGGGRELTEKLAQAMHVEFRIAEQYKRIYGIRKTDRGFRSMAGGLGRISEDALPSLLYAILRSTLDALVNEIERSCRFAIGRLGGVEAGPLFLLGGGGRLQGLPDVLTAGLGVPVSMADPLACLAGQATGGTHPALHLPVLSPCIGLAMAEEEP